MTDIEKVKLEAQLTDQLTDQQIQDLLDEDGSVLAAAAHACEIMAARYARAADVTMDGQSIKRSQIAGGYRAQAESLRERAGGGGLSSVKTSARL